MKKRDIRVLGSAAQEDLRIRAVKAVLGGMTQVDAASVFGIKRQVVGRWIKRYKEGGLKGLKAKRRGRPRGFGRLKVWQAAQVAKTVVHRQPDQLRLGFSLWTREAVGELIFRKFGVRFSLMHVGRYLKRWGFTPQKPLRRAFEQDPEAVRRWLEEEYPAIRSAARRDKAEIHWGDETGVRSDHQAGRSYGLKGRTPVIDGTGKRFSCSVISTITNRGTLRFMVFKKEFNAKVFIRFLRRLIKDVEKPVYLVLDRHSVHKSREVKKWLESRGNRIRMFFLPSYSPDLNPDEMLNNDVKSNAVGRRRARDINDMMKDVRGYLKGTQKRPDIVRNYFKKDTVRYAA
jgi:transposase